MVFLAAGLAKETMRFATDKEFRAKRARQVGFGTLVLTAVGLGVVSACDNKPADHIETYAEGGVGTVTEIDREFSEQCVVAYTTEVKGATARYAVTNRRMLGFIGLHDLSREVRVDMAVDSSLCISGGDKQVTQVKEGGVTKTEYVINPDDIYIRSNKATDGTYVISEDADWETNIADALDQFAKIGRDAESQSKVSSIEEANLFRSALIKTAENKALQTASAACGPKVFKEVKNDVLELIKKDGQRGDEKLIVRYDTEGEDVAISGESQYDNAEVEFPEAADKVEHEVTSMVNSIGECRSISDTVREDSK